MHCALVLTAPLCALSASSTAAGLSGSATSTRHVEIDDATLEALLDGVEGPGAIFYKRLDRGVFTIPEALPEPSKNKIFSASRRLPTKMNSAPLRAS